MNKAIIYNIIAISAVLVVTIFKIPADWAVLGILAFIFFVIFDPFMPLVESIPNCGRY